MSVLHSSDEYAAYRFLLNPVTTKQLAPDDLDAHLFFLILYDVLLLHTQDTESSMLDPYAERVLGALRDEAHPYLFDPRQYFCMLTGIPKSIYTTQLGVHRYDYIRLLQKHIIPEMESFFAEHHLCGISFLQNDPRTPQRQIITFFSLPYALRRQTDAAARLCGALNNRLNAVYRAHLLGESSGYANTMALSRPAADLRSAALRYQNVCDLMACSFFDYRPRLFTEDNLLHEKQPFSSAEMLITMESVKRALIHGPVSEIEAIMDTLLLNKLKYCFSPALFQETLSALRSIDMQLCTLYSLPQADPSAFRMDAYLTVEQCAETLRTRFSALCEQVASQDRILSRIVRDAVYHIHLHYQEPLSLESIASSLYVSPAHLSRMFNRDMPMSIHQYICIVRIDHAKQLLRETAMPVGKIAVTIGLTAPLHFTRLFKQYTGMTPSAYREQHSNSRL